MRSAAYKKIVLLLTGLLFLQVGQAYAQNEGSAAIAEPDVTHFPTLTTYLDVHDAQGNFISKLLPGEVTILENEHPLPVDELLEQQPGVRFILAINAGPGLGIRDQNGVARYDLINRALQAWFLKQPKSSDNDFNLLTNIETRVTAETDPQIIVHALVTYQPDMRLAKPSVQSLSQAIDRASDPLPRTGMGRAILYITPIPDSDLLAALPDLSARAQQLGVHIFIWVTASPDAVGSAGLNALQQAATVTGGTLFTFSGVEGLPDPNLYLDPLGKIYFLKYTSTINQSGRHSLAVKVTYQGGQVSSPARFFSMTVKAPNPMFVSPPLQIERADHPASSTSLENLTPHQQTLELLVEFPDGHPRPLKATRLYINDLLAIENTHEPFNHFNLPLDAYTTSQSIKLKLEVVDSLGLTGASIETPVEVIVKRTAITSLKTFSNHNPWIIAGGAVTAASGLAAGLALVAVRRRRRIKAPQSGQKPADSRRPARLKKETTHPVRHIWSARQAWPQSSLPTVPSLAQFVSLSEQDQPLPGETMIITSREVTFGRDPTLATLVIDLPSLEGLHARLRQNEDGSFILYDQGSVAGTWVNYVPVSSEGARLEHGDTVHFGRVKYRFLYGNPSHTCQVVVKPLSPTP